MSIDLRLHVVPSDAKVPAEQSRSFGDEFCFGTGSGCGPWHTTDNHQSFASYSAPVKKQTELVAIHGNMSNGPLSEDLRRSLHFNLVSGPWSVTSSLYVLHNCKGRPQGRVGPGDHLVPADATEILETTLIGNGIATLQQPIHKDFQNLMMPPGGCVMPRVGRTGTGGINAEYQVTLFTRDPR